jgi:cell division protein FtsX
MVTKHFFKILTIFTLMIVLGLVGVFLVGYLDKDNGKNLLNNVGVAK